MLMFLGFCLHWNASYLVKGGVVFWLVGFALLIKGRLGFLALYRGCGICIEACIRVLVVHSGDLLRLAHKLAMNVV